MCLCPCTFRGWERWKVRQQDEIKRGECQAIAYDMKKGIRPCNTVHSDTQMIPVRNEERIATTMHGFVRQRTYSYVRLGDCQGGGYDGAARASILSMPEREMEKKGYCTQNRSREKRNGNGSTARSGALGGGNRMPFFKQTGT